MIQIALISLKLDCCYLYYIVPICFNCPDWVRLPQLVQISLIGLNCSDSLIKFVTFKQSTLLLLYFQLVYISTFLNFYNSTFLLFLISTFLHFYTSTLLNFYLSTLLYKTFLHVKFSTFLCFYKLTFLLYHLGLSVLL